MKTDFRSDCKDVATYENELKLISMFGLIADPSQKVKTIEKFEFVLDCMHKNGVKLSNPIRARIFEYATLTSSYDLANDMLRNLNNDNTR